MANNQDGSQGPICNECGGAGVKFTINNSSSGCVDCDQTGIAQPTRLELLKLINDLSRRVDVLEGK